MQDVMELVTGATGYIGTRLLRRLAGEGRGVRALARTPERLEPAVGVEPIRGDLVTGAGLARALDGCATAYYLVHSMEAASANGGGFGDRDRTAGERFAAAAADAGVERIVYLGGIEPAGGPKGAPLPLSAHLRSRLEVERILLDAVPGSTALRASIVIGAGSSSFRILVRLVERLRVLPLPAWRANRTQPIAERDVIEYLARTPSVPGAAGRSLDIAGPDVVTYGDMIGRIADAMGVGRMALGLGVSLTPPAAAVVAAVTGQPLELVRPLMESLESDLLPHDAGEAPRLYGIRPLHFDRSVDRALREWESLEPLGAR
ncbi:MAG: NAD(P)H-binding protein [Thermoleophilaceae bacterium]|nr:NAD(P)H-binding protein [Thermoleophilaceae bacterium]